MRSSIVPRLAFADLGRHDDEEPDRAPPPAGRAAGTPRRFRRGGRPPGQREAGRRFAARRIRSRSMAARSPPIVRRKPAVATAARGIMKRMEALRWALVALGLWLISGTALSLSHHPHWYVRGWDFPRVLIAALALACGVAYRALFFDGGWPEIAFLAALGAVIAYQVSRIVAFTPLAPEAGPARHAAAGRRLVPPRHLQRPDGERPARPLAGGHRREADPDVVVALEVDRQVDGRPRARCAARTRTSRSASRTTTTGWRSSRACRWRSRGPLPRGRRHALHPRRASACATAGRSRLYALHPKPPEPLREPGLHAARRRARPRGEGDRGRARRSPTVVCGDLNDVAWSDTTRIFLRVSGLLDPRDRPRAVQHLQRRQPDLPVSRSTTSSTRTTSSCSGCAGCRTSDPTTSRCSSS